MTRNERTLVHFAIAVGVGVGVVTISSDHAALAQTEPTSPASSGAPATPQNAADDKDNATVAAQFFRAGRAAYERREFRAAAIAFLEAYRRVPRAPAMYNAGRAWEAAEEPELAADAYARVVASPELDPDDAEYTREKLASWSADLAIANVRAPVGAVVFVRGQERGVIPIAVHVMPGTHEIHVRRRDGSDVSKSVTLAHADDHVDVVFDDVPPPREKPPENPPVLPQPPPEKKPPYAAWITVGAAGVVAIGGIYTYARFADARSSFESSGDHDSSAHGDAQTFRTWTYVLWGSAIALGIAGGVLFATDSGTGNTRTATSLRVVPGGLVFQIIQ